VEKGMTTAHVRVDIGGGVTITSSITNAAEVRRLAAQGLAVIFATHHPERAFARADKVAVLHEGRLQRQGTPDAIITAETMRSVYGIEVDIVSVTDSRLKICLPKDWR
jgi:iron complex transport system ATP-binding protein